MKSIRNTILFGAFALMLVFGSSLRAQNAQTDYDRLKDLLNDYMVLASQAQGICNQVEQFASNGNMNRLMDSMGSLSRSVSEIGLVNVEQGRITVPDQAIMTGMRDLVVAIDQDINTWAAAQRANIPTVGVIAANLREALNSHRGQAQEIRIAICCRAD